MKSGIDVLAEAVASRRALLFVGAGVSNEIGLPPWKTLVEHMAEALGLTADELESQAVSHQTLAEYYRIRMGSIGPLRSWMDRRWNVPEEAIRKSRLHELIVALDFPRIYTTNYDRNLEIAYQCQDRPYHRIANARDLAAASDDVTQIIKFHGDFDDDASLVLAESDYFRRLNFDSPLDTKFRADALGRTVLFIGYSMTDINIRLLLHKIWQTWSGSGYEADRPQSFVFMPRANEVQDAVLAQWGITVVPGGGGDPGSALTSFLEELLERRDALRQQDKTKPRKGNHNAQAD